MNRTGRAAIDRVIDEFEAGRFDVVFDDADGNELEASGQVTELADAGVADGLCLPISNLFERACLDAGLEAGNGDPGTEGGYPGLGSHSITFIADGDVEWAIDWTAAQYGETEFPLVQRIEGDVWRREPSRS